MSADKTPVHIKIDERQHVEKPLLDQLKGLGLGDHRSRQQATSSESFRESFTDVVMLPVLRERLKVINPWLEDDQVEEVVKQLTASFPSTGLLENNRHLFQLLHREHERQREPGDWREKPDRALHRLRSARQQQVHRRLPVQSADARHGAPHHPGHCSVPERLAGRSHRVQVAEGQ